MKVQEQGPRDFLSVIKESVLSIPALPRPTPHDLQRVFPFLDSILCDVSPTEAVTLALGTVLRPDEKMKIVSGAECEHRLMSLEGALGYQQAAWLIGEPGRLETGATLRKAYIDFPGIVAIDKEGLRRILCLHRVGRSLESWAMYWHWVGDLLSSYGRVALSR